MKAKILSSILFFIIFTSYNFGQNIRNISSFELEQTIAELDKDYVIIDCRSAEMYAGEHIINAINIDAFSGEARQQISNYLDKPAVLLYCTNQNRVRTMSDMLTSLNYPGKIIILEDGMSGILKNIHDSQILTKNQKNISGKSEHPKGKPIVQVFGNFDFDLSPQSDQLFRFWIGRAHFGYQHSFNEQWQAKIIIDAGRPTSMNEFAIFDTVGNLLNASIDLKEGSFYTMNLKFASLEWKPFKNLTLQAGSVLLNHFITQERFWGYRYLAPTFQDKYYGLPSGDLGIIAYYKICPKIGLDISLTNGEGFRKDQDLNGNIKIASGLDFYPLKSLQTRIYYEYYKSTTDNLIIEQQMFSAFIGYRFKNKFRIGAEYNSRFHQQFVKDLNLSGYSVFGTYCINENFEIFARYDHLTNSNNINILKYPDLFSVITGVQYTPVEGIHVGLNYQGINSGNGFNNTNPHLLLSFEYKF